MCLEWLYDTIIIWQNTKNESDIARYKTMSLFQDIQNYKPFNEQEETDRMVMLQYMMEHTDYLERANQIAHFSTSIWTVNKNAPKHYWCIIIFSIPGHGSVVMRTESKTCVR